MLVAIYHMIRDDADFLPIDHEETATCNAKTDKVLNLKNIIAFLGEHGADAEMLRLVETQCSESHKGEAAGAGEEYPSGKEKQSRSDAQRQTRPEQETAQRKNRLRSRQTEQNDPAKQPVSALATA